MGVEMKTKSTQQRRAKGSGSLFQKRGRFIYKHRDPTLGRIVYKTLYDDNGSPVSDRKTAERQHELLADYRHPGRFLLEGQQ